MRLTEGVSWPNQRPADEQMITMNGMDRGRGGAPVDGWAPSLRWPMQNRRICTVADLPELDWAADHIGGSVRALTR
jgi:hypothetical protein